MIITRVHQSEAVRFVNQDHQLVEVGQGELVGSYFATSFRHSTGQRPDEGGLLRFTFATADEVGVVHVHISFLSIYALLPDGDQELKCDPNFFDFPDASIKPVELPTGSLPVLRFIGSHGLTERQLLRPTTVGFQCRLEKWGLDVRLRVRSDDPFDQTLAYKLPLSRLLWRPYGPGTIAGSHEVATDLIWFKRLAPLSDYDRSRGLQPGPIRVTLPK